MLNQLQNSPLFETKSLVGLEAVFSVSGQPIFHFIGVHRKGEQLEIADATEGLKTLKELTAALPAKHPLALVVTGKGIIHRHFEQGRELTDVQIIGQSLPQAKAADFYVQRFYSGTVLFASIIRKSTLDKLLQDLLQTGYRVIDVTLGGFNLMAVKSLLAPEATLLEVNGHRLYIEEEHLQRYDTKGEQPPQAVQLGEETIPALNMLSFAAAFETIFGSLSKEMIGHPSIEKSKTEELHKKLFEFGRWGILSVFFAALLVNYFLFDHYAQAQQELQATVAVHKQEIDQVTRMKEQLADRKQLVETIGITRQSRTAFYADQLAQTLPKTLVLTQMAINPMAGKMKAKEKVQFYQEQIVVSGQTDKGGALNDWIADLKKASWVEDIQLADYRQDKKTGLSDFRIKLTVR